MSRGGAAPPPPRDAARPPPGVGRAELTDWAESTLRLYLIRHAEPAYPADELSVRGHAQARALAAALAEARPDRIFSSPMKRALDTARYTAERLGREILVEEWMAELEAWALDDPARGEIPAWEIDPVAVRGWAPPRRDDWNGLAPLASSRFAEDYKAVQSASDAFLARQGWRRKGGLYDLDGEVGAMAAFCHCGLALTWLAHLLEIPAPLVWAGFTLPPSSVTVLDFQPVAQGGFVPRCSQLGGLSHLAGASPRSAGP